MPDAPLITISDPNNPLEPGDVIQAGPERTPIRLPRRVLALLLVGAVLGTSVVLGVQHVRDQRARDRLAASTFAREDKVTWRLADDLNLNYSIEQASGQAPHRRLNVSVSRAQVDPKLQFVSAVLTGRGLSDQLDELGTTYLSDPFGVSAELDCAAAASGQLPTRVTLTVIVRPPSGQPHPFRRVFPDAEVTELTRGACGLPDPTATTTARFQVFGSRLQVTVAPVIHAETPTTVLGGVGLGLSVDLGAGLPRTLHQDTTTVYPVTVRVTDCTLAETTTSLGLRVRDARGTHLADPDPLNQPDPRVAAYLTAMVERACP